MPLESAVLPVWTPLDCYCCCCCLHYTSKYTYSLHFSKIARLSSETILRAVWNGTRPRYKYFTAIDAVQHGTVRSIHPTITTTVRTVYECRGNIHGKQTIQHSSYAPTSSSRAFPTAMGKSQAREPTAPTTLLLKPSPFGKEPSTCCRKHCDDAV